MMGMGGGDSSMLLCCGAFMACCALYGCHQCAKCHIRDCSIIKRMLRCCCCDPYPDMEIFVVVHDVQYTAHSKFQCCVRITAGRQIVQTDYDERGQFHQPFEVFVEQGTEFILFEMLDDRGRILATHQFHLEKDIMQGGEIRNKLFSMKQKEKAAVNPRIKITLRKDAGGNERCTVIDKVVAEGVSAETAMIMQDHLAQIKAADVEEGGGNGGKPSELDLLSSACSGSLEQVGSWGTREEIHIAMLCPPDRKKHTIGIWQDKGAKDAGKEPKEEIDLLKVVSVQADAGQARVFHLNYWNSDKVKCRHTFNIVDRGRDVWVECWGLLIGKCHELKEQTKGEKEDKKDKKDKKEKKKGK